VLRTADRAVQEKKKDVKSKRRKPTGRKEKKSKGERGEMKEKRVRKGTGCGVRKGEKGTPVKNSIQKGRE